MQEKALEGVDYGYIDGVYYHKPEELKVKSGRPRKYVGHSKSVKSKKDPLLVSQVRSEQAIEQRGVAIVELDYYTGEYVGEYNTIKDFAKDYDLSPASISSAMRRKECAMHYIHEHEKLFMKKSNFEIMFTSLKGMI